MALAMASTRKEKRTDYIEFGYVLDELIRKYRIRSQTQLSREVEKGGYPVSQSMISYFMLGDYEIPARFVVKVIEVMHDRQSRLGIDHQALAEDTERLLRAWWNSKPPEERHAIAQIYRMSGSPDVTAEDLEDTLNIEVKREEGDGGGAPGG